MKKKENLYAKGMKILSEGMTFTKKQYGPEDLPKDGSEIHIHMPAAGSMAAKTVVLKYNKANFIFDVMQGFKPVGRMGEKQVLENLNSGLYQIKSQ